MIEDIYAENLVDSPDEIEQVIEGGEGDRQYESGRESGNEEQKNEAEDKDKENNDKDKTTKVRRKLGPRMVLNAERLNGPRGIGAMESFFSDINLVGKGHEKEDLELVMKRLEHWAHRLAPRMQFDDCLKKIEKLGSKKEIANRVNRIRIGFEDNNEVQRGDVVEDAPDSPTPLDDRFDQLVSSVPAAPAPVGMTAEQREQMLRNRLIAEERRAARIKKAQEMKQKYQEKLLLSQSQAESVEPRDQTVQRCVDEDHQVEEDVDFEALSNYVDDKTKESSASQDVHSGGNQIDVQIENSEDNFANMMESEIENYDADLECVDDGNKIQSIEVPKGGMADQDDGLADCKDEDDIK